MGDQLAVDGGRKKGGQPLLLMIEVGTGSVLEVPFTFAELHENLIEEQDAALASEEFAEWAKLNPEHIPLRPSDCVGFKVPLFLGGGEGADNLEVVDLDVYWSANGQLRAGTKDLPERTPITKIELEL
jgi:hypothetical protein